MSLLFNMLSRFVIAFLPRSKCLLISWLPSPSAVILEPKKIKCVTVSIICPSICHEVMGPDVMILVFWVLSFTPAFSLSSFTFIRRLFSSSQPMDTCMPLATCLWVIECCSTFLVIGLFLFFKKDIYFYSFIWLSWVLIVTWRIWFPDQVSNPGPLHWDS